MKPPRLQYHQSSQSRRSGRPPAQPEPEALPPESENLLFFDRILIDAISPIFRTQGRPSKSLIPNPFYRRNEFPLALSPLRGFQAPR